MIKTVDGTQLSAGVLRVPSETHWKPLNSVYAKLLCEPMASLMRCIDECPQNSNSAVLGYN